MRPKDYSLFAWAEAVTSGGVGTPILLALMIWKRECEGAMPLREDFERLDPASYSCCRGRNFFQGMSEGDV
jgi:hypothetical protein